MEIREAGLLKPTVYGPQMVAVNYGPVVTLIRHFRPYSWIHTHMHIHSPSWTEVRRSVHKLIRELEKALRLHPL